MIWDVGWVEVGRKLHSNAAGQASTMQALSPASSTWVSRAAQRDAGPNGSVAVP